MFEWNRETYGMPPEEVKKLVAEIAVLALQKEKAELEHWLKQYAPADGTQPQKKLTRRVELACGCELDICSWPAPGGTTWRIIKGDTPGRICSMTPEEHNVAK